MYGKIEEYIMDQINERKKVIDEYRVNVLPDIIDKAQQIKSNSQKIVDIGKKISEDMEDLIEISKTKLKGLDDRQEILLKSGEKNWNSFTSNLNDDYSKPMSLNQLNSELQVQIVSPLAMIAASGSTMMDSSGNVCNTIFSIVADEMQLPIEDVSSQYYHKCILENKNAIRSCLEKLLPTYLPEFNNVIRDWESKNFRDMNCLIGLRTVIFGKLFGLMFDNKKYNTTKLYNNQFFMNSIAKEAGKDYYNKVLYFIIGDTDPSKLPLSLVNQIVDIANKLSILQQKLSTFGKIREQQTSNLDIELFFQQTIFNTAEAIRIREAISSV